MCIDIALSLSKFHATLLNLKPANLFPAQVVDGLPLLT